jgi:hypothetical protein
MKIICCEYSPGVIFTTLTNEPDRLQFTTILVWDKHSNLLGPFMSNKDYKVLCIMPLMSYSQHVMFFITNV